jgi:TPR repeat protein
MSKTCRVSPRWLGCAAGFLSITLAACGSSAFPIEDGRASTPAAGDACAVCGPVCAQPDGVDPRGFELGGDALVLAALHDDAVAQHRLGMMFLLGDGVEVDDRQAAAWLLRAAEQGHADAQNELGAIHEFGRGVPRDDVQAQAWYALAAAGGHPTARARRDRLAVTMQAGDLARARVEAESLRARIEQAAPPAARPGR